MYESKGYKIIHMSAPDKKYNEPGYVGPSYFEEIMDMYMRFTGYDVVFDRSIYGECVWPEVYGREPMLTEEEIEELLEVENQNLCQHIVLYDKNVKSHWQRCVDNNEPLDKGQFNLARKLFFEMADKYGFGKKTIQDFGIYPDSGPADAETDDESGDSGDNEPVQQNDSGKDIERKKSLRHHSPNGDTAKAKLEKANAINKVLSSKIIRNKGEIFEELELDIRAYLEDRMAELLGGQTKGFTQDEIDILKLYVQRLKKLEKERK